MKHECLKSISLLLFFYPGHTPFLRKKVTIKPNQMLISLSMIIKCVKLTDNLENLLITLH